MWLNEGLAEFFSTFQYEKGRAIIGRPLEAQLIFLNQVAWLPLQAVLAAKMDSPEYNEDFRNSVFYAQAWALVHYLLCAKDTGLCATLEPLPGTSGATGPGSDARLCRLHAD